MGMQNLMWTLKLNGLGMTHAKFWLVRCEMTSYVSNSCSMGTRLFLWMTKIHHHEPPLGFTALCTCTPFQNGFQTASDLTEVQTEGCYSLWSGHSSILPTLNLQPAATRAHNDSVG